MARNNRMHMTVSESDLDYLDKWLSSDGSPPNSMMLSDLDGFLTAVAIGPDLIMPSEWLPVVWGGGAPEFKSQRQAQRIMETMLGRYNEILHTLDTDPDAPEPIFPVRDDGTVIVGIGLWASRRDTTTSQALGAIAQARRTGCADRAHRHVLVRQGRRERSQTERRDYRQGS
jgi:hypothetical protein